MRERERERTEREDEGNEHPKRWWRGQKNAPAVNTLHVAGGNDLATSRWLEALKIFFSAYSKISGIGRLLTFGVPDGSV